MITTPQKLHRWASATAFVLAQGTHQAKEQRENQIKQCSDGEQNLQTDIMQRHHAKSTWGPYSFVLLTRNTRLAWCLCMMSVCKFCSPSLHCLIWFSRCSFAWWVPWARTKAVADAHLCNFCGVVIIDMLADRRCFSFFTWFVIVPLPEVRYLWYPRGSLGGFVVVLGLVSTENATAKRQKILFFSQQILWSENVVKGSAQYKFGLAYWYHLYLVTKNIIKVYKKVVCDFIRFLQIYLCLLFVYFFWHFLERLRSFQLLP